MMKFAKAVLAVSISVACVHAAAILPVPTTVPVGSGTHAIVTDPLLHRAFVSNRDSGTVSIIDLLDPGAVGDFETGTSPVALLSDAATSRVYVLDDTAPGTLTVMNGATGDVVGRVTLGDHPQSMAADFARGRVYVSNAGSSSLSVVDINANQVVATIPVGRIPQGIAVDAARGAIYVSNTLDATVSVIDRDTLSVTASADVGRGPGTPLVDARTGRLFVNAVDDRAVYVLDATTHAVVAVIPSGSAAAHGALSPEYRKLYLSIADDQTVVAVDLDGLEVTGTYRVGHGPQEALVDADAGTVYVPNLADSTVSVIDPQHDAVAGAFSMGSHPSQIAIATSPDRLLIVSAGLTSSDRSTFAAKAALVRDTAIAVEYATTAGEHYFHTADPTERRLLDDGILGTAWARTETYWRVWTVPAADRIAVCRFSAAEKMHALGSECEALKRTRGGDYEGVAYYVMAPRADGSCAPGTEALFRLVDRGAADGMATDRITPDPAERDAMLAKGWLADGIGAGPTFACTPSLRASSSEPLVAPDIGSPSAPPMTPVPIPLRPRPKDADAPSPDVHDRLLPILHVNAF
jgi:YVTN family beta-propeller protein